MTTSATQPSGDAGIAQDDAARILAGLNQLTDLFRRRLLDDKAKAQAISALSAAADAQRLAPLCREFALLLDRIAAYRSDGADAQDFVASIGDEILAILAHYGFEPIASPKTFDPTTQRIVGISEKPPEGADGAAVALDNTVVAVQRAGYRLNGTVIRPEEVIVYRGARKPVGADGKSEDAAESAV